MKLSGNNDTYFEMSVVGYQFPELANEDYDSNWLNMSISVSHPNGSWMAIDPSLLTYELRGKSLLTTHKFRCFLGEIRNDNIRSCPFD